MRLQSRALQHLRVNVSISDHEREATRILTTAYGDKATFRDGQLEAVSHVLNGGDPLLLVQRTGWGKSAVYFIATKLLRDAGSGLALVFSPLLALTRNQISAAARFGLQARAMNSATEKIDGADAETRALIASNALDLLFITPEQLANPHFTERTAPMFAENVGLVIVDEAHCISDWGHDFRPEYRRIGRFLENLVGVPIVATTATANDRVVRDVQEQLRTQTIHRGPLVRDSLALHAIRLPGEAERLAWIADVVPNLPGSGIVYVLTVRDARKIAEWLNARGITSIAYSGKSADRESLETQFLANDVKVVVATSALGMGFDKPDVGFVIHYQRPASIIAYYQQVGRAGREIDPAYGVLLEGEEDDEIADYFIRSAIPLQADVELVLETLEGAIAGYTTAELLERIDLKSGRLEAVLKYLETLSPSPVTKVRDRVLRYYRSANPYRYDAEAVAALTSMRKAEQARMKTLMAGDECLMQFIARELDDPAEHAPCGRCSACAEPIANGVPTLTTLTAAEDFLLRTYIAIEPRKQWPNSLTLQSGERGRIRENRRAEPGFALAAYGVGTVGRALKQRVLDGAPFDASIIDAAVRGVRTCAPNVAWVTVIPSRSRPQLRAFAEELARRCELPFFDVVTKSRETASQKRMQNAHHQVTNIDGAFLVTPEAAMLGTHGLLVDDIVNSGWTFTMLASALRAAGTGPILPFAIATTRLSDD